MKRTPFFALGLYGHIQWRNDPALDRAQPGSGSGGLKKGLEGPEMTQKMKNRSFSLKETYFNTKVGKCSSDKMSGHSLERCRLWGSSGHPKKAQKKPKTLKKPKTSKICPKTRNLGEILSRFFLVKALGTYTMTIWPGPQLSIARAWVRGAQKKPKLAQNDQKLAKYVPKLELLMRYVPNFS